MDLLNIPIILSFLTNINLLLVLFYKYTARYIDLHLLCLIVAFVSFGITYIYPRKVYVTWIDNSISIFETTTPRVLIDVTMHWLPLLFVLYAIPFSKSIQKITLTFFLIISYSIIFNAPKLYKFDIKITFILIVLALIVRFAMI